MAAVVPDGSEVGSLLARLHPEVRHRRIGSLTYLLAPDGVTCVALSDADLESAAHGDGDVMADLERSGFVHAGTAAVARRVALTGDGIEVAGLDRAVERVVRPFRRLPHLRWGSLALALAIVALAVGLTRPRTATSDSVVMAALILLVLDYLLLVVHELGHAVVLHWHGERIGRVGFGLHWGMPCFYVDGTAALMLPRRARAWQASAGVIAEAMATAALLGVGWASGSTAVTAVAGQAAILTLSSLLINLVPALDLDGAWLAADLLDRPQLVHGADDSGWVRMYRLLNGGIGLVVFASSVLLWVWLWSELFVPLWQSGIVGMVILAFTVLPMAGGVVVSAAIVLSARSLSS